MSDKLRAAAKAAYKAMIAAELSDGSKREWDAAVDGLKAALAEPEQEPVAWISAVTGDVTTQDRSNTVSWVPLYTAPPRREWVGLTGDEIEDLNKDQTLWEIIRAAEEILKEKNT